MALYLVVNLKCAIMVAVFANVSDKNSLLLSALVDRSVEKRQESRSRERRGKT